MHAGERATVPPPHVVPPFAPESSSASVDTFATLFTQFQEHSLKINTQLEKILTYQEEIQQGYQNDLAYVCSSI